MISSHRLKSTVSAFDLFETGKGCCVNCGLVRNASRICPNCGSRMFEFFTEKDAKKYRNGTHIFPKNTYLLKDKKEVRHNSSHQ